MHQFIFYIADHNLGGLALSIHSILGLLNDCIKDI